MGRLIELPFRCILHRFHRNSKMINGTQTLKRYYDIFHFTIRIYVFPSYICMTTSHFVSITDHTIIEVMVELHCDSIVMMSTSVENEGWEAYARLRQIHAFQYEERDEFHHMKEKKNMGVYKDLF